MSIDGDVGTQVPKGAMLAQSGSNDDNGAAEVAIDAGASDLPAVQSTRRKKRRKKQRKQLLAMNDAGALRLWRSGLLERRTALNVFAVVAIAAAIAVAVGVRFRELRNSESPSSTWSAGDQVDVELTLVAADAANLACASTGEVGGRRCAFESPGKRLSANHDADDEHVLKPYTTTAREQLLAASLWSQPALRAGLPDGRFTLRCKYTVEGILAKPAIRWASTGRWNDSPANWRSGVLSDCAVVTP